MKIFSNKRSIREYIKSSEKGTFLENSITIKEFKSRIILIDGYRNMSDIEREYIFNLTFSELRGDEVLSIEKNLLKFLAYSDHFFSFFKELALENVDISLLAQADFYEDFRKHISFLKKLIESYKTKLINNKIIDDIFIPELYKLNFDYLNSIDKIEFYLDGQINNFDMNLFREISKIVPVKFIFARSKFYNRIDQFLNIELEPNFIYSVNISNSEVLTLDITKLSENIKIYGFRDRFTQIGFIKEQIYSYNQISNIPLDKIAVVLLDEKFSEQISKFLYKDNKSLLNFSMGFSIRDKLFWQILHTIYEYINRPELLENNFRFKRFKDKFNYFNDIYLSFKENWNYKDSFESFKEIIMKLIDLTNCNEKNKIEEILVEFYSDKFKINEDIKTIYALFYRRLNKITIDDSQGGSITAMGLLETRGVEFEAVIVVDFNDDVFPKQEEKDLFINSEIRRDVGLPLIIDRENLQKLYFERLLQKSKYVSISFLDNNDSKISRFFHDFPELKIEAYNENYEQNLINISISRSKQIYKHWDENISAYFYISNKELSNHKFSTFFNCRRKYYFKYILEIKEHSIEDSEKLLKGTYFHDILQLALNNKSYTTREDLEKEIYFLIDQNKQDFSEAELKMFKLEFTRIIDLEFNFFQKEHYQTVATELTLTVQNYRGFKLKGKIDRLVQKNSGEYIVVDYKSSSSKLDKTNFQLIFYYILLKENGYKIDINNLYFYIFKGQLLKNKASLEDFNGKLDYLIYLEKKNMFFDKSEQCETFCPYINICL